MTTASDGMVAGAVALARALGGADVTLECPLDPEAAEALGREIREGLAGPGGGPPWRVVSVTVRGDPPGVGAIKLTISTEAG